MEVFLGGFLIGFIFVIAVLGIAVVRDLLQEKSK